jgi:hypothetical protein
MRRLMRCLNVLRQPNTVNVDFCQGAHLKAMHRVWYAGDQHRSPSKTLKLFIKLSLISYQLKGNIMNGLIILSITVVFIVFICAGLGAAEEEFATVMSKSDDELIRETENA